MKKSSPWWWNKIPSQECPIASSVVMDYLLSECGVLEPSPEQEDRFYCGPSDDIWKKFELLPTPPRSPSRPTSDDEDDLCVTSEPKLNLVSDLLDSPDSAVWGLCPSAPTGLKNDLLHDCMWSGQCRDTCKRGHSSSLTASFTPDVQSERLVPTVQVSKPSIKVEPMSPEECATQAAAHAAAITPTPSPTLAVDPCTMLPYTPLSDHSYHTQQQQQNLVSPKSPPLCDTPSDTEDDEIDVVTLPASVGLTSIKSEPVEVPSVSTGRKLTSTRRRPPGRPATVPPLRVVIPASALITKHKDHHRRGPGRKRFQKRHNATQVTSSSSAASSNGGWVRRHYKRRFASHHHSNSNRTISCSSDSEDCVEKRSMHNSMERKRRDDLRFAFQTLREHVPDLASNPKAPKVLILNRAASYARQLSQTGAALEKTLKQETRRRQELQRRLMQLNKLK